MKVIVEDCFLYVWFLIQHLSALRYFWSMSIVFALRVSLGVNTLRILTPVGVGIE